MISKYKFFSALLVFLAVTMSASAQWYDPDKVPKKAGNYYAKAYEEAKEGKYREAIVDLDKALAEYPKFVDVYLSRAGIYADLHEYSNSVRDFEKGFEMDAVYADTYLLPYSISLAGTGNFDKALQIVNTFLNKPGLNQQSIKAGSYRKSTYEFALKLAKESSDPNYVFSRQNMGDSINSGELEYFPSLTIDGKRMIFTRRINSDEDFYESRYTNGQWGKAVPVSGKINTNFNEGAQNISQDGDWLIFTGCNYPEGGGSCDLYIAYKTKKGNWTEPQNLGPVVNSEFWESSPSLSPDKRDLYFSANRPGGYGGKDLWVSRRTDRGSWSKPVNLGPSINTSADEASPFIHPDNQSLYFSSNGLAGYGKTDLFVARKIADSAWGTAKNLGYPINTIDDEGSLIVNADGRTGYYASDGGDTKGGLDLYTFQLPQQVQAARTIWVSGQVYDAGSKVGLPSLVELTDLENGTIASKLQTDEDGNYLVTLPLGKEYAFSVNRKNYLFYSDNYFVQKNNADTNFIVNIALQPIVKGATTTLKNIFFDVNKATLQNTSITELNNLVNLLKENTEVKLVINGYTDNVGTTAANLILSTNRAKAVADYLIRNGIAAGRLRWKGYGEQQPVAINDTEEGRAKNRRTEIVVE